jgi:sialic acid synthase SpsE
MMQQTKLAGGDAVKVQLYDSQVLLGNDDRLYVELTKQEFKDMKQYAEDLGLDFFAFVFNMDRVGWCEELGIGSYKIVSPTVSNKELCQAMIDTGKPVYVSLGMYDLQDKGFPYEGDNITYFYCVSKYPTKLDEVEVPTILKGIATIQLELQHAHMQWLVGRPFWKSISL